MSTNNTPSAYKTPPTNIGTVQAYKVGDKLVARKPSTKNLLTSGSSLLYSEKEAAALLDDSDDGSVQFEKTETNKDPIANATIIDAIATQIADTSLKKPNKKKTTTPLPPKDLTRLVSICGIAPTDLARDDLRKFAAGLFHSQAL